MDETWPWVFSTLDAFSYPVRGVEGASTIDPIGRALTYHPFRAYVTKMCMSVCVYQNVYECVSVSVFFFLIRLDQVVNLRLGQE